MIRSFYFAHPTTMYDAPVERSLEQGFQQQLGVRVENPNQPQHSEGYKKEGMDYFVKLCDQQDGVFFAPFADGTVGAGVAKEVDSFARRGAPVYEYDATHQDFAPVDSVQLSQLPVLSVDDTRAHLKSERQLAQEGHSPYQDLATYQRALLSKTH